MEFVNQLRLQFSKNRYEAIYICEGHIENMLCIFYEARINFDRLAAF